MTALKKSYENQWEAMRDDSFPASSSTSFLNSTNVEGKLFYNNLHFFSAWMNSMSNKGYSGLMFSW